LVHDSRRAYDTTSTSLVTLDSEFTVVYNSLTNNHELKLNIEGFVSGVRLEIEQRTGQFWQPIEEVSANEWVIKSSLLTAVTPQAMFIQQKTTELPDYYYYGGDPTLTDNNNFELTDDNNNPIEGY
jgi:predicted DNA-binding ribbon-helix-helix protein